MKMFFGAVLIIIGPPLSQKLFVIVKQMSLEGENTNCAYDWYRTAKLINTIKMKNGMDECTSVHILEIIRKLKITMIFCFLAKYKIL